MFVLLLGMQLKRCIGVGVRIVGKIWICDGRWQVVLGESRYSCMFLLSLLLRLGMLVEVVEESRYSW